MAFRAPLLGYNTNVRHKGKLYHIQTEDSGVGHPHIITHLFADGGRIVASKKTSYDEHVGSQALQETVKKLMQAQHKAMFIALRDGVYDEGGPNDAARDQTGTHSLVNAGPAPALNGSGAASGPSTNGEVRGATREQSAHAPLPPAGAEERSRVEAREQNEDARIGSSGDRPSLYQGTRAAGRISDAPAPPPPPNNRAPRSIFGGDLLSEKSLDEVILSYLATDEPESKR